MGDWGEGEFYSMYLFSYLVFLGGKGRGGECKICRLEMGWDEFSRGEKGKRMNTEGYCTNKTLPTITNTIPNPSLSLDEIVSSVEIRKEQFGNINPSYKNFSTMQHTVDIPVIHTTKTSIKRKLQRVGRRQ